MKYLIKESQKKLILETNIDLWLKRRISKRSMDHHISNQIDEQYRLCDDFDNEEEYAVQIIDTATDDYLYELDVPEEFEEDAKDKLYELIHERNYDYLCDVYNKSCGDYDEDDDED